MSTVRDRKDTLGLPVSTVKRIIRIASGRKAVSKKLLDAVMISVVKAVNQVARISSDHVKTAKRATIFAEDIRKAVDSCRDKAITETGMIQFIKKHGLGEYILPRQTTSRILQSSTGIQRISLDGKKVWQVYVTYVIGLKAIKIVNKLE